MSIARREEDLFRRWERGRTAFVRDGVIDEEAYRDSTPKIAYVLKEVNSPGERTWDLRDLLRTNPPAATWANIVRWTRGLRKGEDIRWAEVETVTPEDARDVLRTVVVMNVKKSPGGRSSVHSEVAAAAEADSEFLAEQLDLYRPDLVVCCGVDGRWIPQLDIPDWQRTTRGVWYCRFGNDQCAIGYHHPQARWPNHLMLYGLIDAARELRVRGPA